MFERPLTGFVVDALARAEVSERTREPIPMAAGAVEMAALGCMGPSWRDVEEELDALIAEGRVERVSMPRSPGYLLIRKAQGGQSDA